MILVVTTFIQKIISLYKNVMKKIGIVVSVLMLSALLSGIASAQTYDANGNLINNSTNNASGVTNTTNATDTSSSANSGSNGTANANGSTSVPGLPNTGAGGDAVANTAIILTSGLVLIGASIYLMRREAAL
jgi:hypothetical protein